MDLLQYCFKKPHWASFFLIRTTLIASFFFHVSSRHFWEQLHVHFDQAAIETVLHQWRLGKIILVRKIATYAWHNTDFACGRLMQLFNFYTIFENCSKVFLLVKISGCVRLHNHFASLSKATTWNLFQWSFLFSLNIAKLAAKSFIFFLLFRQRVSKICTLWSRTRLFNSRIYWNFGFFTFLHFSDHSMVLHIQFKWVLSKITFRRFHWQSWSLSTMVNLFPGWK